MPLKGNGNKFINNGIGVHNEAQVSVELNDSTFENNKIGYLEGKLDRIDELFKNETPELAKKELIEELSKAIKRGESEKAESLFEKFDFHKWIASGANIAKIVESLASAMNIHS